jgi:hypothetical protein
MSTKPLLLNVRSCVVGDTQQQHYLGIEFNRPISACLLLMSLPIVVLNTCLALGKGEAVSEYSKKQDCLGRPVQYQRFSSGLFQGAPVCMRELGLEWIWILMQEPKSKFNRYVIGTPLFLIRTFVFNRASRGF